MDLNDTVLSVIESTAVGESYETLRKLLAKFMFKGTSVEKKASVDLRYIFIVGILIDGFLFNILSSFKQYRWGF